MDKNVHITVSGCANVGKSSVMHKIIEVLREEGFEVEIDSPLTMMDYGTEFNYDMQMRKYRDLALEAIKGNKIIICEKQFHRDFTKQ